MNWRQLWNAGKQLAARGLHRIEAQVKEWTKPAPDRQITGIATDLFRSKTDLIAENAFLRQQLIAHRRQHTGRPPITQQDRRILVFLASKVRG
jgi:hypothetical protein